MINGSKEYAESPNRKTGIGSVSFLLTEEFKKKTGIMHASWPLYHYILKAIFLLARSLNVQGKITLSVDIIRVMFI